MSKNYYNNSFAKNADENLVENEEKIIEPVKEELTVEEPKVEIEKPVVESPVKEKKEIKIESKPQVRKGKVIVIMGDGRVIVSYQGHNYFVVSNAKFGEEIEF